MYSGQTMMQTAQNGYSARQDRYSGQLKPCVEYDRQIRYLDYMENGQRSRGAGFVKLERRDNRCNISLQVSGLYRKDHFTRPLLLLSDGEERELCKLQLADGGIKLYLEGLDSGNLDGQGLAYERLTGLRIPISEGKEIRCLWSARAGQRAQDAAAQHTEQYASAQAATAQGMDVRRENRQSGTAWNNSAQNGTDWDGSAQNKADWNGSAQNETDQDEASCGGNTQNEPRREEAVRYIPAQDGTGKETDRAIPKSFKEDKWEQLWSIYPHIHPFADEREYLSFGPSDLVVLPARYYKLVNNSFLLHGFYNYHHLIFTKIGGRNGTRYYIGVPGNLNQTERRTAIMFGFENFECDREPAGEGDFGYYLIPVEL